MAIQIRKADTGYVTRPVVTRNQDAEIAALKARVAELERENVSLRQSAPKRDRAAYMREYRAKRKP